MAEHTVSFGFLLPTREAVMAQGQPDFRQLVALAEQAEALGFDSLWAGDSILARPRLEALTTLAAVATRTQRVKLGTAVLLPALRHPVVLANEVANLDLVSQGRMILGVGIATKNRAVEAEFAACGVPFGTRIGRFEESLTLLRRLWTEPEVTFHGRHFQLQEVRLGLRPLQAGGVPLWLAGAVDNALRRVLRLGDGWLPNPPSPQAFAEAWQRLQALAAEMGKPLAGLHRGVYTTLNINDDAAQAEREMQAFIEGYYGAPYEVMRRTQGVCAGPPERCIAWLNDFVAAGAQTLVLRFGAPDQRRQLERCARDVLPHVRRA
ncbi:MAG: N5,N10-methylene tetrahydromethanopterin reductase [Candidatus Tectimicrobiota bacterium]|nr:MAG: N5,N10-methylene tetrahydromethanopterin reductase [Candidatus Tectomicrobia bacterium]